MYALYWAKDSGAIAPQVLLEEIGAEYRKIVIDLDDKQNRSPEFLAVNPTGEIPALILPDGTLMTESAAIVLQIVDRHPEANLAPPAGSSQRAGFLRWLLFMASTVYSAVKRFYYSDRCTTDPAGVDDVKAAALMDMDRAFSTLNEALEPGPYLLGKTFSAADVYLWMLSQWHPDPSGMSGRNPRVGRLMDLVEARPAVAGVWAQHREEDAS